MHEENIPEEAWMLTEGRIAASIGIRLNTLRFMSSEKYKRTRGYTTLQFKKRSGGIREIDAPNDPLKKVQRWILRSVLARVSIHDAAHGFRNNRSIMTNVATHVGQEVVIRLDLKDFFGAVRYPRIRGLFRALGYIEPVALLLTGLTTYRGRLPQGAPSSPAITNIVCRRLDARLSGLSAKFGFAYTRYADDLVFSGTTIKAAPDRLIHVVSRIVREEGFEINSRKTSIMRRGGRQKVTGLVVNEKINVPRVYRRILRAEIFNARRDGLAPKGRPIADVRHANMKWLQKVEGKIGYIYQCNTQTGDKLRRDIDRLLRENAIYLNYAGRRKLKGPFPIAGQSRDISDIAYEMMCEELGLNADPANDESDLLPQNDVEGDVQYDMDGLYDVEDLYDDFEDGDNTGHSADLYWSDDLPF